MSDIATREIAYQAGATGYSGLLTWDAANLDPKPGVLLAPTVRGRSDFEQQRATELVHLGYTALVIDLYGSATRNDDIAQKRGYMNALRSDRAALQAHMLAWLALAKSQPEIDANRVAAIGYCFGGLCVLDLARTGADFAAAVSFHGIFAPPGNTAGNTVRSKVLALHGWDDPLATPEAVVALGHELTDMGADWQIHAYGNTLHAFTNPAAQDSEAGTVYSADANRRSWQAMQDFFAELFGA
jgi:dienelactone hydrolase